MRFFEEAVANFAHVLLVVGNHDHYDAVLEDTVSTLRTHQPGVSVLDDDHVEVEGASQGVRVGGGWVWFGPSRVHIANDGRIVIRHGYCGDGP